ncbi:MULTISPECIES: glycine-rich domain-containing protein [Streptomyces]|uniref:Uncharacterized protein n=1 Tax=Streptomyces lycii TaxID=2654337 RepID=A0ABQ7FCD8_9ACTN|nr:hypothetical protein [Streptomyces lycii]KAF4406661.1 hypothetical protein GCU69_23860 [Streptomyces lycii]
MATPVPRLEPLSTRDLLSHSEHTGVVATVTQNNPGMTRDMAERVVDQALAFVATAACHPTARIAPSRVVDEGWHALILHTALYGGLCRRLGGFVHHFPERPDPQRYDPDVITRTTGLIERCGYRVDHELWGRPDAQAAAVAAECQHSPNCGPIEPSPQPQCLPSVDLTA